MTASREDSLAVVPNQGWDARIHVVRCGTLVQVFVVVTQRYVVLVDTLLNRKTAAALLDRARPHLTAERTLLVVNTHADWDHAWGNEVFAGAGALHPAPIFGSRRCAERLQDDTAQQELAEMQANEPERFAGMCLQPPTVLFGDRLIIDGGDLTLELFATPGHTPDHIAVFIPELRTLLAGDAAELPFPLLNDPNGVAAMRTSLTWMQALRPTTVLYCHAPVTAGPDVLRANLSYLDELERKCAAARQRHPGPLPENDAQIEALVGFPFSAAVPPGVAVEQTDFYQQAHRRNIRVMLGR